MTAPPGLQPQRGGTETEHKSMLSVHTAQEVEATNFLQLEYKMTVMP